MQKPNLSKATFVHGSFVGSHIVPCKILRYGKARCSVSYVDPISEETVVKTIETKDLTFKKEKKAKIKEDNRVLVTFEIESDLYFKVLQACVDRRENLDEFFEAAIQNFLARYEEAKNSPAKMKVLKAEIKKSHAEV